MLKKNYPMKLNSMYNFT